jgi:glycine/serine hydroxymethyltransferase
MFGRSEVEKQHKMAEETHKAAQEAQKAALEDLHEKSVNAVDVLEGKILLSELPEPYLILHDQLNYGLAHQTGVTFNNAQRALNVLARNGYRIVSTTCDNHTMYVFMEKKLE